MLGESFGFNADKEKCMAAEYVCCALRHFAVCIKKDEMFITKRENEYDNIMKKLKSGKEKSK